MNDVKTLGQRIHVDRLAAGQSINDLATAARVVKATIFRLEHDEIKAPSPLMLTRIARALGVEAEDYFALAGYYTPQGLPELSLYLRAKYDADPAQVQAVEDYFNQLRDHSRSDNDQAA